jgi:hypothetical protein
MQRIMRLVVFMAAAVLLGGGAAWADGDFYVIAGGGAPMGTKITSVPCSISSPGFYYLTGNLTYSGSLVGNAITVTSDDVTLDLMGFSLTNSYAPGSTIGIDMYGRSNVEVRNGTVRGFFYGVREGSMSGNNHRVLNLRANGNGDGIRLAGSNHLVKGCNASNNSLNGIYIVSGLIAACVASNNYRGVWLYGPGDVLGNTAFNNSNKNFFLGNEVATAILVDRNSAFGLATNYSVVGGTTGVQWGTNAGTP